MGKRIKSYMKINFGEIQMSKELKHTITVFSVFILIMACVFFIVKVDIKRYAETCANPPSEFWIEEDLEMVFLTTQLYVMDIDNQGDGLLIVKVKLYDEGTYHTYRCLYKVKRKRPCGNFVWEFERYVE